LRRPGAGARLGCPSRRRGGGRIAAVAERGRRSMDWICWVVPVKPGKTDVAREYCQALETSRRADYEASERELGIDREVFFLWTNPEGKDYIDPNFYDGLVVMGVTRGHQGRLPEAMEYFRAAIRSQPDVPKARVQLAHALWQEKHDEAALEEMRRASQLAPKDPDILADLGLALGLAGRIPESIEQLHEALRLNPNSAEAHNNLGLALLASGKARESIPEFEVALRLKPELKGAADNLHRAQAQLK